VVPRDYSADALLTHPHGPRTYVRTHAVLRFYLYTLRAGVHHGRFGCPARAVFDCC